MAAPLSIAAVRRLSRPAFPAAGFAFWVVSGLILLVAAGPLVAPHDPYQADFLNRLAGPSATYPLGTDAMGRCLLSRLLHGAQLTTLSALSVVATAAAIGILVGAVSGYFGGLPDRLLMRLTEGVSVLPALAIAIVIAGILGLGLKAVILALAAVHWTDYARLVRNVVMVERSKTYVMAAEALGVRRLDVIRRHLLPNIAAPLLAMGTYSISWVILSFAGLSFLGLGVEPGTPEWGRLIAESRSHLREYPRLVMVPGFTIMAFVIAINLIGDATGDRLRHGRTNFLNPRS
ncbi:ABC transporter permease [Polymorphum gilvum]|uniref:ABC transporter, permease protein n=1 Tax=Polymorphum gilvum (strain LMG 25793 / CGMCC 1.9160 / SL003B-26A1) TaxID=991905 RepID=F2J5U9_POLGS|nr:ABC transporter permease [Polymorphum gilvum]ADZ71203.1 ABC transporter, permease protein [Polymorphum gilvum SL003B-26A1]